MHKSRVQPTWALIETAKIIEMRCMYVYLEVGASQNIMVLVYPYPYLPDGIFVDALCQIIDDHFVLPWSEVNEHRSLDLCPVLVDDH